VREAAGFTIRRRSSLAVAAVYRKCEEHNGAPQSEGKMKKDRPVSLTEPFVSFDKKR
jgi:hypothetical protein